MGEKKNPLIHPIRWLPKNTTSVSSEKYCVRNRHTVGNSGGMEIKSSNTFYTYSPAPQTKIHTIGGHVKPLKQKGKCSFRHQPLVFSSSQFAFKREYFHFVNILIIFMKNAIQFFGPKIQFVFQM